MKHSKSKTWGRFWAGAICASLWSWLAFAVILAVMDLLDEHLPWGDVICIGFGLLSFAATFYCAAVIATGFWSTIAGSVANRSKLANWNIGTIALTLTPMITVSNMGLFLVIFLWPVAWWFFGRGMRFGDDFWKQRRWRNFFGLTNDYERDDKS